MCEISHDQANADWKAQVVEPVVIKVQDDLFDLYNPVYPDINGDPQPGYPIYVGD